MWMSLGNFGGRCLMSLNNNVPLSRRSPSLSSLFLSLPPLSLPPCPANCSVLLFSLLSLCPLSPCLSLSPSLPSPLLFLSPLSLSLPISGKNFLFIYENLIDFVGFTAFDRPRIGRSSVRFWRKRRLESRLFPIVRNDQNSPISAGFDRLFTPN